MMAMKYFDIQMTYRRTVLDGQMKKINEKRLSYVKRSWEGDYRDMMKLRRLEGRNDVGTRKRSN